ncbi:sensor histidine kinase [Desulfuromonas versatilis]|uniref:histidine kinase n=1 Tax=Desulfuromonas versatilis TaxID=2802975 RepID=A0ABN6E0K8_9BACT|nr:ATP-binding protein [Desulfuromonas versatilis]BCR05867.1 sensor histidine kinase [Desulfuromonas versatilis]
MSLFRPRSFLLLVLLGFGFVSLPLIVALINAEIAMGKLARQGTLAVFRSVGATQGGRILVEDLIALERRARQYEVLGDQHLLEEVGGLHEEIDRTLRQLLALPLEDAQHKRLRDMEKGVHEVVTALSEQPRGSEAQKAALERFTELNRMANRLYSENNELIVREVNQMQKSVSAAQKTLIWQAVALIPFSILFVALFTHLLSRPIKQIVKAIHRLGEGDMETPAQVRGPRDLEFLGERLDWLRNQLAEVERAKSKFVAQVSHELKTPLASIREGAELLADEVVGPLGAQQREIAGIIRKGSIQLQKLIDNLLGFSKAQAIISPMHYSEVDLERLAREVVGDYKLVVLKKDLGLDMKLEPVHLQGDRERLRTIVDNLVSNAIKYTPANGRITIRVAREAQGAVLEVVDSGPGIPAEERGKVFEPFYQGKVLPSPGHIKGTGLGLSIVREFVTAHQGTIQLLETPVGSHFRVTLPLSERGADA